MSAVMGRATDVGGESMASLAGARYTPGRRGCSTTGPAAERFDTAVRWTGLHRLTECFEPLSVGPGKIVLGPLGEVLVVFETLGEVGDRFDAVGVGSRDQGHVAVADNSPIFRLVVEGAGKIPDGNDKHLLDHVGVERDSGHLAELRQALPLVDDECHGFPQRRVRLHEFARELVAAHLLESLHLGQRVLSMVEHSLLAAHALGHRHVIIVEDFFVDLTRETVLLGMTVLDGTELQVRVRVADSLFEFVGDRERGRNSWRRRPTPSRIFLPGVPPMLEDSVDDLTRVMAASEEEKDLAALGLEIDAGRVDSGPHVRRRFCRALRVQRPPLESVSAHR